MNEMMNDRMTGGAYGRLVEPGTLSIERLLPGPASRVWDYLTRADLRRQWLADGDMDLVVGAGFELVWHNDRLNDPPSPNRPEGFSEEHRLESRILAIEPGQSLTFSWCQGNVTFTLDEVGSDVLLTVVHRRISDRANTVMVGAGWHMHLDVLVAVLAGRVPEDFWRGWLALRADYERRIAA